MKLLFPISLDVSPGDIAGIVMAVVGILGILIVVTVIALVVAFRKWKKHGTKMTY